MGGAIQLKISKCPATNLALTNCVYVSEQELGPLLKAMPRPTVPLALSNYVRIKQYVYNVLAHKHVPAGTVALNGPQRQNCYVSLNEAVDVVPMAFTWDHVFLVRLTLEVAPLGRCKTQAKLRVADVQELMQRDLIHQFLVPGQNFRLDVKGATFSFRVLDVECATASELSGASQPAHRADEKAGMTGGIFMKSTELLVSAEAGASVRVEGADGASTPLFRGGRLTSTRWASAAWTTSSATSSGGRSRRAYSRTT